jgi:hypothetical protein
VGAVGPPGIEDGGPGTDGPDGGGPKEAGPAGGGGTEGAADGWPHVASLPTAEINGCTAPQLWHTCPGSVGLPHMTQYTAPSPSDSSQHGTAGSETKTLRRDAGLSAVCS